MISNHLWSVVLIVAVIFDHCNAAIPYHELDIPLSDGSETYERQIKQSLETTKNFFARDDVKIVATAAGKLMNYIPVLNTFSSVLPGLQSALASESDFRDALARAIPDGSDRNDVQKEMNVMKATLSTISHNVRMMQSENEFSSASKTAMVHDIYNDFDKIVNQFLDKEAVFRKHPLITIRILFALAPAIAYFVPIQIAIVPAFANHSRIACNFETVLLDYRQLAAENRLSKTQIMSGGGNPILNNHLVRDIMGREFNEFGYTRTNSGTILCANGCVKDMVCLKDLVSGAEYNCYRTYEMYGCLHGWMEQARHRVENAFKDPIQMMTNTCSDEIRHRPRPPPTGNGWWDITFHDAEAYVDAKQSKCDDTGDCDVYFKLLVNDKEVFKSDTVWDRHMPYFGETYHSPLMSKNARITIEMWDDDSGFFGSPDDLIIRWETSIDELLKKGMRYFTEGTTVVTTSAWRDEYPDY